MVANARSLHHMPACRFKRAQLQGIPFAAGSSHVCMAAEPFLRGHYVKYNGNNGHVDADYAAGRLAGTQ